MDISLGVLAPPRCRGGVSGPGRPKQTDGPVWQNRTLLLGDERRLCVALDSGPSVQQAPSLEGGSWGLQCVRAWRILQLQVEIAPLQNGARRCNVPEFPGRWGAHRGLSGKSEGTAVAGTLAGAATKPLPPTLSA